MANNSILIHKKNFEEFTIVKYDKKDHALRVEFVVGRRLQQITDWSPVNPRTCVIRIRNKFHNVSFINTHALIEGKGTFYNTLERT